MWNDLSASESEGVMSFVELESDSVSLESESGLDASLALKDFPNLGCCCSFEGVGVGWMSCLFGDL